MATYIPPPGPLGTRHPQRDQLIFARGRVYYGDDRTRVCHICNKEIQEYDLTLHHDDGECLCTFHHVCMNVTNGINWCRNDCPACGEDLVRGGFSNPFRSTTDQLAETSNASIDMYRPQERYWEARDAQRTHLGNSSFFAVAGYQEQETYRLACEQLLTKHLQDVNSLRKAVEAYEKQCDQYFTAATKEAESLRRRRTTRAERTARVHLYRAEQNFHEQQGHLDWAREYRGLHELNYQHGIAELHGVLRRDRALIEKTLTSETDFAERRHSRALMAMMKQREQFIDIVFVEYVVKMKELKQEYHAALDRLREELTQSRLADPDGYKWEFDPPEHRSLAFFGG